MVNYSKEKSACFIGHRNAELPSELKIKLKELLVDLIEKENVVKFLFGSKSKFDTSCYYMVLELQEIHSNIKIVGYPCTSEYFCLKENVEEEIRRAKAVLGVDLNLFAYDEVVDKNYTGRGGYLKRNQQMILDSDYCIFYYDKNYEPSKRYLSKRDFVAYQPNSGTKKSFEFSLTKKKEIINIKEFYSKR